MTDPPTTPGERMRERVNAHQIANDPPEPSGLAIVIAENLNLDDEVSLRDAAVRIDEVGLAALIADRDALAAIVERLPEFKDGVKITPEAHYWFEYDDGSGIGEGIVSNMQSEELVDDFSACYSTKAAAIAAREADDAQRANELAGRQNDDRRN